MPELPEVETVRRGLQRVVGGGQILEVETRRPDLRFVFPEGFAGRLIGTHIAGIERRGKYLLWRLSSGRTLLCHLGMTGVFHFGGETLEGGTVEDRRHFAPRGDGRHDHVRFEIGQAGASPIELFYRDPRRFGFMDIIEPEGESRFLAQMGPEPLGNGFNADALRQKLARRKGPIKSLLLDQTVVAGLGNIYVVEALWRAGIAPFASGQSVAEGDAPRLDALVKAIRDVLGAAIEAGGSTLSDFRHVDGETGYFQHQFDVYGRAGGACRRSGCGGTIERTRQAGRSSFFCNQCQADSS